MTEYVTGELGSQDRSGRLLVTSPISQSTFEVYPQTIKVKRPFKGEKPNPPTRSNTQLQGFSDKSRSRLRFVSTNSGHILRSQFGLTYPGDHWPTDGREFKRHLNTFLTQIRKHIPFLNYLWVAEFQSRGAPHVHLFLDLAATDENRRLLAHYWCKAVNPDYLETDDHYRVHSNPKNFIPWAMRQGSYLCKYLDKAAQKTIPAGFFNFGRWWGNSRGLVSSPETFTADQLAAEFPQVDEETGEVHEGNAIAFLVRVVGRYHEKQNRRSWFRKTSRSTSALTGGPIFRQALEYLRNTRGNPQEPEPF